MFAFLICLEVGIVSAIERHARFGCKGIVTHLIEDLHERHIGLAKDMIQFYVHGLQFAKDLCLEEVWSFVVVAQ